MKNLLKKLLPILNLKKLERMKFGIDISKHQSANKTPINWGLLKQNDPKVDFVYIKATQGVNYVDPFLKIHADAAHAAGIPIGYYHFASLNDNAVTVDATREAKDFLRAIALMPKATMPLALDIEENKIKLSREAFLQWINAFCSVLKDANRDFIIYSGSYFLDENLPKNHGLGNIRLWLAQYTKSAQPKLPRGWDKYYIWQYSCEGKVKGIIGDVDLNKMP